MGETLRIHAFSFLFDMFQIGAGRGLGFPTVIGHKATQCQWFWGPSFQKLEKQNFMDNTREEMSFIMEHSVEKRSSEAHTEGEGPREGCLSV